MWNVRERIDMLRSIFYYCVAALYVSVFVTVIMTAHVQGYATLLQTLTQENGLYESVSVILLLCMSGYGVYAIYMYNKCLTKRAVAFLVMVTSAALVAAMEELSWGQHLWHFQSSAFFLEHNYQHETNLHNFIDANLFSSVLYSSVYVCLVFIPLLYKILLKKRGHFCWLRRFDIGAHAILMVLFASSLQLYFYDDVGVTADRLTLFAGLLLFGYYAWYVERTPTVMAHYVVVLAATGIFMTHYKIFDFYNAQYEIREMFVIAAVLLVFMEFINGYRAKIQ